MNENDLPQGVYLAVEPGEYGPWRLFHSKKALRVSRKLNRRWTRRMQVYYISGTWRNITEDFFGDREQNHG